MPKSAIICVDDEKIVLDSLKKELKNNLEDDFFIEVAEDGNEAIEILEELMDEGYDIPLVISDYIMPEMKGDEVLFKVRELRPETYSIMLTGQATIEGVTNAINKAGLYRYIAKPWETNDLVLTVSEAIKSYDKDAELKRRRRELEKANEKLLKLDSAKTYFLGLLSHELNTPLIGINGNAKLICEFSDDPDVKESAEQILDSEARLRKFADLSLLITRIQTDKYETSFYQEKLQDIMGQALFNLQDKMTENQTQVTNSMNTGDFLVKVDVSLVTKVFEFIMENSMKFSGSKGTILIESEMKGAEAMVRITDNGPGFSQQKLNNVFEFFASSENLMGHSEGTGLSLAASKVIMDLHGFDIVAHNTEPNGAVVEMFFKG